MAAGLPKRGTGRLKEPVISLGERAPFSMEKGAGYNKKRNPIDFSRKGKPDRKAGAQSHGPKRDKPNGGRAAKGGIQMKRVSVLMMVLAALLVVGLAGAVQARELARAELKVRIEIPVMQRLTVLEPTQIYFQYPADGQAVEFKNVGRVRVQSNADWALTVGAVTDGDVKVAVRPAGDRTARWQYVDGTGGVFTGQSGSQDISWDVRIEGNRLRNNTQNQQGAVQLYFTLGRL